MKKFLHHFRISLMLGLVILGCFSAQSSSQTPLSSYQTEATITEDLENVDPVNPDLPKDPVESFEFNSDLIIKALNPGYTINGTQNVGEFIELQKNIDEPNFSLAGYGLRYINSSGNSTLLLDFAEGSLMTGETLLVRLSRSPNSEQADATYMTTLAMTTGRLELIYNNNIVDQVCWGDGNSCMESFRSAKPTTLVRNLFTGIFEHITDYEPSFDSSLPSLILPPSLDDSSGSNPGDSATEITTRCYELEFSEIFSYYVNAKSEQFVEIHNPSDKTVIIDQCALRYKNKIHILTGEITADGYYAYYPSQQSTAFTFTKNPNSSNKVELIDANGSTVDSLTYNHGQKKSTSYAQFYASNGEEIWDQTYAPTPGRANTYQEFRTCPTGKTINPDTGNCVNITSSNNSTTVCPEGKYLNPLTGRCKKISDSSNGPKPCATGYERNPDTNRCRKITSDNNGANYALIPNTSSSKSVFVAAGVVALIVSLGVLYIILQFRREIARTTRKIIQRLNHIRKNLITRRVGFHWKKKS